ncbi:MAG: vWA domain-containing protein [Planctomycetota bacterium]
MFRFESPWAFLLLLLLPLMWWWMSRLARSAPAVQYSSILRAGMVGRSWRTRLAWIPAVLRTLAFISLVVAIARPQTGIGEVRTTARGVAMMLVVDRSWSMSDPMMYDGEALSRIDVVKRVSSDFVLGDGRDLDGRTQDLVGLVTFGRFADTLCPLVRIHDVLVDLIEGIQLAHPQSIDAGTAIGEGIALAAARLRQSEEDLSRRNEVESDPEFEIRSKAIILMTDGDENMGEVEAAEAAQLCREWGIRVYAIGIGSREQRMETVQTLFGPRRMATGYPFREEALKELAEVTNGRYFAATDGDALREVYSTIDELEKTEIESKQYTNYYEAFMPWAAAAVMMLLLELLLRSTVLRRVP